MSTLPKPLPVVLCGKSVAIGGPAAGLLQPDYEVVHFIQSNEAALAEIPHLLAGRDPQSSDDNGVGTHEYGRPVRAVIFGRGYSLEDVQKFHKASAGSNEEPVVWIAGDPAKKPDLNGPQTGLGYAQAAADGVKAVLEKWKEEGATKDGIVLW
ncbi:uncharacterized protein N7498_002468 [Penicillium cinerascens]|uniref:Uncharacterized protein n=1 Tax=Penicillium cinerascens TaxID=70096 RepID=A0A9W9NA86_9EURO|nr:uncharacterized protein N7498_002468 [Penicillium cinerascens]KAJ5216061.1 hypothetical protein N7498_002468 [Penicillium cinerascens]